VWRFQRRREEATIPMSGLQDTKIQNNVEMVFLSSKLNSAVDVQEPN